MGCGQVLIGTHRDDAGRVDVIMCHIVVPLDMVEIDGLGDAVGLVEIFEITEQAWVIDDATEVAFEVAVIDRIESDQGDEQPPVRFDEFRAEEITLMRQP